MVRVVFLAAVLAATSAGPAIASSESVVVQTAPITPAPAPVLPALTELSIELLEPLSSDGSKSLDPFAFRLAEPVLLDGRIAIPAGTMGTGEVVHAKKAGGSGTPGELVLAARTLDVNGMPLKLRSMRFAQAGTNRMGTANAINTASAAAPIPGIGLIGFAVTGSNIRLEAGHIATAMTAEPFAVTKELGPQGGMQGTAAGAELPAPPAE